MLDWRQLVWLSDAELSRLDIAAVSLACAEGLPGAPSQTQAIECIDRLDHYARSVQHYTGRRMPEFEQHPEAYEHSEGIFRVVCLVTLLQKQFGIRYNPDKKAEDSLFDTADVFVHGALIGKGGTCASLPVAYAAVGRRLGYPLKLVCAYGGSANHLFARWDDLLDQRFNIETNDMTIATPPDEYYRTGRYQVPPEIERAGCFLQSMTHRQELANFLVHRAHRWHDHGKLRQAVDAWCRASALHPENELYLNTLKLRMNEWLRELRPRRPPGFPDMFIKILERRYPATLPLEIEQEVIGTEATENALNDSELDVRWWDRLRRNESLPRRPVACLVDSEPDRCSFSFRFAE